MEEYNKELLSDSYEDVSRDIEKNCVDTTPEM
jgi:hypothetical protein